MHRGVRRPPMQREQRPAGERQPDPEDHQSLELVRHRAVRAAHAEGESPVGRGIAHRRDQQRREVRHLRSDQRLQHHVEQQIGQRAQHADDREPHQLSHHAQRHPGHQRFPAHRAPQLVERQRPGGQRPPEPPDAEQVLARGVDDVDAAVRVIDPVHRNLVDAQTGPLGEHQQFGVEEPLPVVHQRQQTARHVGAHRLEAALGVGEVRAQRCPQQQVVAARDDLALGPAHHAGRGVEPGADGQVGMPGDQRCDQGQQCVQVGGQVDVHVGDHLRVGAFPHRPQRPPAPLRGQVHHAHVVQFFGEQLCDLQRVVGARVVGDRDARREGESVAQVGVQSADAHAEVGLFVVDGYHHVQHGRARGLGPFRRRDGRSLGHANQSRGPRCHGAGAQL